MNLKSIIKKVLNYYLVHIQMGTHYYWEMKKKWIEECVAYIDNGGKVNTEWVKNQMFLNEALKLYRDALREELYTDESLREEYRMVNKLIGLYETK